MSLDPSDGNPNTVIDDGSRPPRLPRWTRQEILVLIQGKSVAECRVRRGRVDSGGSASSNPIEPKWASVSSYCRRHGVNRGPVQCRKRWSNLAGDYKKIKEWEVNKSGESESYWVMRNDLRRERKLPGFFDREVYDILEGGGGGGGRGSDAAGRAAEEEKVKETDEECSDYEPDEQEEGGEQQQMPDKEVVDMETVQAAIPVGIPISTGTTNEKQNTANVEKGTSSQEGRKRKYCPSEDGNTHLQDKLIEVLETNSRLITTQLEAQNLNCELDRDQRKEQTNSLVAVLSKLADSLGKIADKL